jgi:hypothetical protein
MTTPSKCYVEKNGMALFLGDVKTPFYVHKIKGYVNGHCMGDTSFFHIYCFRI